MVDMRMFAVGYEADWQNEPDHSVWVSTVSAHTEEMFIALQWCKKGSFALSYPLSPRGVVGYADSHSKKGPPTGGGIAKEVPLTYVPCFLHIIKPFRIV
jgi:hypothetical protein